MIHRHNNGIGKKGLSIIELVFVVLILSLLAAIAIPQLVAYRTRGNSASANIAARQAYGAAESFFSDNPGGTVSVNDLSVYGYNPHHIDDNWRKNDKQFYYPGKPCRRRINLHDR